MEHKFIPGEAQEPVFVLLHGTGGNMNDLLPVAEHLNPKASILSLQGEVLENGMRRFFKRFPDASFDWQDLEAQAEKLILFLKQASQRYQFNLNEVVLVGFSNGANMAINLLLNKHASKITRGILFHPMYPSEKLIDTDLSQTCIFTSLGVKDPIVTVAQSEHVIELFKAKGANVTEFWTTGHQLTYKEVDQAKEWLLN